MAPLKFLERSSLTSTIVATHSIPRIPFQHLLRFRTYTSDAEAVRYTLRRGIKEALLARRLASPSTFKWLPRIPLRRRMIRAPKPTVVKDVEKVVLFPGYAVKRAAQSQSNVFLVEVFVSGYATSSKHLENAPFTHRAFIRVAKSFTGLPKLTPRPSQSLMSSPPPTPTILEDSHQLTSEPQPLQSYYPISPSPISPTPSSSFPFDPSSPYLDGHALPITRPTSPAHSFDAEDELARLHAVVDSRLGLFTASWLPNRDVKVSIYQSDYGRNEASAFKDVGRQPLVVHHARTDSRGYFSHRFKLSLPEGHPIVAAKARRSGVEYHFKIQVDLLPIMPMARTGLLRRLTLSSTAPISNPPPSPPPAPPRSSTSPLLDSSAVAPTTHITIPMTSAKVRVISDIDDTVKRADVPLGIGAIYRNVFVKDLKELVLPGMANWYNAMKDKGVHFHYVSMSPFQLLPEIRAFFDIANLPKGSITLKYYGGRSMLRELWTSSAKRKLRGALEILDTFKESKFFLIGDSGQQDLELYTAVACARPEQILAIFIRDASAPAQMKRSHSAGSIPEEGSPNSRPSTPPISPITQFMSTPNLTTLAEAGSDGLSYLTDVVWRGYDYVRTTISPPTSPTANDRHFPPISLPATESISPQELQDKGRSRYEKRLAAARQLIPKHVVLKLFTDPAECTEALALLESA